MWILYLYIWCYLLQCPRKDKSITRAWHCFKACHSVSFLYFLMGKGTSKWPEAVPFLRGCTGALKCFAAVNLCVESAVILLEYSGDAIALNPFSTKHFGYYQQPITDTGHNFNALSCTLTYLSPQFLHLRHINFLYTCLSAKITNKFEPNNIKFHKSLYAETGGFKYVGVQDRALKLYPAEV